MQQAAGNAPIGIQASVDEFNQGTGRKKMGNRIDRFKKALQDFFFGAAYLEFEQTARQEKAAKLDLILLFSYGDLLGVPVFPPYYSLRLLPYFFPALNSWKKRMLREKDLTEMKSL
jgi:hypothetical protein